MTTHPLPAALGESASPSERRRALEHARACPECRDRLVAEDPTRIFSLLADEPIPALVLDRVTAGVEAGLSGRHRSRRSARPGRLGSLAASVLLAGALGAYLLRVPAPEPRISSPDATAVPEATLAVETHDWPDRDDRHGGIELLSSPGDAQVLDLSLGETHLVMIFDEALKL